MALVKWAHFQKIKLIHIPNEGKRSLTEGYNLKKMGLSPGFMDLFLPEARGGYFGLFLEMKQNRPYATHETKTKTWINQKNWIDELNKQGYFASFCFGWEQGMNLIQQYCRFGRTLIQRELYG